MGLIDDMPVHKELLASIKNGLLRDSRSKKSGFRKLSVTADRFLKTGYEADPNEINYQKFPDHEFGDIQTD